MNREEACPACPYSLLCLAYDPLLFQNVPACICDRCHRLWVIDREAGRSYRCKEDRVHLILPDSPFGVFVCPDCTEDYLMEKARKHKLNDAERASWVNNDEGLYDMQRRSGLSMRAFIKENRAFLDECILNVLEGRKPASYLKYGG